MGEAEATARSDFPGVNEHELVARWCSQGCPRQGAEGRGVAKGGESGSEDLRSRDETGI